MGTAVLMDACRKYGVVRYHQVSTDEVYGDLPLDRPDLFLQKKPLFIQVLLIAVLKPVQIYWYLHTIVLMAYQ